MPKRKQGERDCAIYDQGDDALEREHRQAARVRASSRRKLEATPSAAAAAAAVHHAPRDKEQVVLWIQKVKERMYKACKSPSSQEEKLCRALRQGRAFADVARLLDSGAEVNYISCTGFTPLNYALEIGTMRAELVALLLERGAGVNAPNIHGRSAVHFAAANDREGRCLALLLDAGADVDARDEDGETALFCAALDDNAAAVETLLAAGASKALKPWSGFGRNKVPFDVAKCDDVRKLLRR